MKTKVIKKRDIQKKWFLLDASGIRLGRLATKAAELLIGKDKVAAADNLASGDYVIIINAAKVSVHPRKKKSKKYYSHSGYMGSLKEETLESLLKRRPEEVVEKAVKGMLPNNKLREEMLKQLFIYPGEEHKHQAQEPQKISI